MIGCRNETAEVGFFVSIAILFRYFLNVIAAVCDPISLKPLPPKTLRNNKLTLWTAIYSRIFQPSGRMMACINALRFAEGPKVRWDLSI